jgi:hypothetical protein
MTKTKSTTKTGTTPTTNMSAAPRGTSRSPKLSPAVSAIEPQSSAPTKQALVVGLLERDGGATLDDLVAATGWLRHTTRAALTRLRQAGHLLDKVKGETGATVYRIGRPARGVRSRKAA